MDFRVSGKRVRETTGMTDKEDARLVEQKRKMQLKYAKAGILDKLKESLIIELVNNFTSDEIFEALWQVKQARAMQEMYEQKQKGV